MSTFKPDGAPFFWIPKEAFEVIEQRLECGPAASAKLTYAALVRVACNERKATFSKPIAYLAPLASLERRTVEKRLLDLERIGLVTIDRVTIPGTKAKGISRYTLPKLNRTLTNARRSQPFAVSREGEKRTERPSANGKESPPARFAPSLLDGFRKGYAKEVSHGR